MNIDLHEKIILTYYTSCHQLDKSLILFLEVYVQKPTINTTNTLYYNAIIGILELRLRITIRYFRVVAMSTVFL